ncbi:MAG: hypothetical protein D6707_04015, partial [Bacteroidetes bacterium]
MRKNICTIFLLFIFGTTVWSQPLQDNKKYLKAYFSYAKFYSPEYGPYIETYLTVIGNTLEYKNIGKGKKQGEVEITTVIKEKDSIINFKKYKVLSPIYADSAHEFKNFIDVQRLSVPDGKYDLYLEIRDVNSLNQPFTYTEPLTVDFDKDSVNISDIELIEKFYKTTEKTVYTKHGYDIFPYQSTFYPDVVDDFLFYFEIYNTTTFFKDEPFLVNYYLSDYNSLKKMDGYFKFKRKNPEDVIVIIDKFNIEKLPSGNYYFNVDIVNKENQIVAHKHILIQRLNPEYDITTDNLENVDVTGTFVDKIT